MKSSIQIFIILLLLQNQIFAKSSFEKDFSLLRDLTCEFAKDELEKHPEMNTIALIELENNFPHKFSSEVLKCLPNYVTKVIMNPHTHASGNSTILLSKSALIIYIADKVEEVRKLVEILLIIFINFKISG